MQRVKKANKKVYEQMDLDKFEKFADGDDFLERPMDEDLRISDNQNEITNLDDYPPKPI